MPSVQAEARRAADALDRRMCRAPPPGTDPGRRLVVGRSLVDRMAPRRCPPGQRRSAATRGRPFVALVDVGITRESPTTVSTPGACTDDQRLMSASS